MRKVHFTPEARDDLKLINAYTIEHWGKSQALEYIDGLETQTQNLANNPALGINRDYLIDGLFSFPYVSHVLYYIATDENISIIRVLHKNMDADQHLK